MLPRGILLQPDHETPDLELEDTQEEVGEVFERLGIEELGLVAKHLVNEQLACAHLLHLAEEGLQVAKASGGLGRREAHPLQEVAFDDTHVLEGLDAVFYEELVWWQRVRRRASRRARAAGFPEYREGSQ